MSVLEYVLDGLEAALSLERELGARTVECDRSLLAVAQKPAAVPVRQAVAPQPVRVRQMPPAGNRVGASSEVNEARGEAAPYGLVFIHDRALSADGVRMMAKIVTALGETAETAPIVFTEPFPKALVYVVLGGNAVKKWFPGLRASPGQWVRHQRSENVLVTYSPEYILRFGTVTPAVKAIKLSMWESLKGARTRVAALRNLV